MKVVLDDGMTLDCRGYKALDSGVVLTADTKRKKVFGFVPHDKLQFILPDEVVDEQEGEAGTTEFVYIPDDERQQRIDALESEVATLEAELATQEAAVADAEAKLADIEAERAEEREAEREAEDLTVIDGIGPKYAERLTAAGITTFRDLRAASIETVAAAADVSEERAEKWITATSTDETAEAVETSTASGANE